MINAFHVQSVPGTEEKSDEPTMTREELKEQERLRYGVMKR